MLSNKTKLFLKLLESSKCYNECNVTLLCYIYFFLAWAGLACLNNKSSMFGKCKC